MKKISMSIVIALLVTFSTKAQLLNEGSAKDHLNKEYIYSDLVPAFNQSVQETNYDVKFSLDKNFKQSKDYKYNQWWSTITKSEDFWIKERSIFKGVVIHI